MEDIFSSSSVQIEVLADESRSTRNPAARQHPQSYHDAVTGSSESTVPSPRDPGLRSLSPFNLSRLPLVVDRSCMLPISL